MSTSGGCLVHSGDIMSTSGHIQYIGAFNNKSKAFVNMISLYVFTISF